MSNSSQIRLCLKGIEKQLLSLTALSNSANAVGLSVISSSIATAVDSINRNITKIHSLPSEFLSSRGIDATIGNDILKSSHNWLITEYYKGLDIFVYKGWDMDDLASSLDELITQVEFDR